MSEDIEGALFRECLAARVAEFDAAVIEVAELQVPAAKFYENVELKAMLQLVELRPGDIETTPGQVGDTNMVKTFKAAVTNHSALRRAFSLHSERRNTTL